MFYGDTSHASADPWNGNSAVDAMELYTTGLNYYREHILPTSRIHYQIEKAGDVVNVVPDYAKIWTRSQREQRGTGRCALRTRLEYSKRSSTDDRNPKYETKLISGIYEILVNRTGAEIMQE